MGLGPGEDVLPRTLLELPGITNVADAVAGGHLGVPDQPGANTRRREQQDEDQPKITLPETIGYGDGGTLRQSAGRSGRCRLGLPVRCRLPGCQAWHGIPRFLASFTIVGFEARPFGSKW